MRAFLQSSYPGLWSGLVKLRSGTAVRSVGSFPNLVRGRVLRSRQAPYFFADLRGSMGLGATLSTAVAIFHHCDRSGLRPFVRFTSPNYSPDPSARADWLPLHFVRRDPSDQDIAGRFAGKPPRFLEVRSGWDLSPRRWDDDLDIARAGALFHRHMGIQPEILAEAEGFARTRFGDADVLGVHFRGTDKSLESPRVGWEVLAGVVDRQRTDAGAKIFVATDEPEFLQFMLGRYGRDAVLDLDCREIYSGSRAAHFTAGDPFVKAREAILTMLLLSRCRVCVRTPSHLSAWAKILNPSQRVVMLAKPTGSSFHFPDSRIWEECQIPAAN